MPRLFARPLPYPAPDPNFPTIIPTSENTKQFKDELSFNNLKPRPKHLDESPRDNFDFPFNFPPHEPTTDKKSASAAKKMSDSIATTVDEIILENQASSPSVAAKIAPETEPETEPKVTTEVTPEAEQEIIPAPDPNANPVEITDHSLYERAVKFLGKSRCSRLGYEKNPPPRCLRPSLANFFLKIIRNESSRLSNDLAIAIVALDPDTSSRPLLCYDYDHILKFPITLSRIDVNTYEISPSAAKVFDANHNRVLLQDDDFVILVCNEKSRLTIHICQK